MNCKNCGSVIPEGSKFCGVCGAPADTTPTPVETKTEAAAPAQKTVSPVLTPTPIQVVVQKDRPTKEEKIAAKQAKKAEKEAKKAATKKYYIAPGTFYMDGGPVLRILRLVMMVLALATIVTIIIPQMLQWISINFFATSSGDTGIIIFKVGMYMNSVPLLSMLGVAGIMLASCIFKIIKLKHAKIKNEIIPIVANMIVGLLLIAFFFVIVPFTWVADMYLYRLQTMMLAWGYVFALLIYCAANSLAFGPRKYAFVSGNSKLIHAYGLSVLALAIMLFIPWAIIFINGIVDALSVENPCLFTVYTIGRFMIGCLGFITFGGIICIVAAILNGGENKVKDIIFMAIFVLINFVMFVVCSCFYSIFGSVKYELFYNSYCPIYIGGNALQPVGTLVSTTIAYLIIVASGIACFIKGKKMTKPVGFDKAPQVAAQ